MKNRLQSAILAILICALLSTTGIAGYFPDVDENASYAEAVEYLNDVGIMQGDEKGYFNPDQTVTRAEMATIICRMLDITENLPVSSNFSDVPTDHWANGYIGKAAAVGIVNGYGDGRFGPSDDVLYEEALTMVVRAMDMDQLAIVAGGYPDGYVSVAIEQGFMEGIPDLLGEPLSRAMIAQMLYNALYF